MAAEFARLQVRISSETEAWEDVSLETDGNRLPIAFNTAIDGSGDWLVPLLDSDGHQQVDVLSMPSVTVDSEFPAAAEITDNFANPTTTSVMAMNMVWDGATWDRWQGAVTMATLPDTSSSDLAAITAAVETIDNAISGSEMQVDIVGITPDLMLGTDFSNVFGTASIVSATPAVKVEEQGTVTVDATGQGDIPVTLDSETVGLTNIHSEDFDTGAGTDTTIATGLAVPQSGGAGVVEGVDLTALNITPSIGLAVGAFNYVFDGSNWDYVRMAWTGSDALSGLTTLAAGTFPWIYDRVADDYNRMSEVANATDSTGIGIQGVGLIAQFDDTSPTTVTENQFGNLRMSAERSLYTEIRDAAGNERGLNVDANGEIGVTNQGTFAVQVDDAFFSATEGGALPTEFVVIAGDDGTDTHPIQIDNTTGGVKVYLASQLQNIISGTENDTIGVSPTKRADAFNATITSADASTATQIYAKTAGKKIYVTDLTISVDTAMNVQIQDDTGTPVVLMEQMYFPANSIWSKSFITPLECSTNTDLDVITSTSGNISVTASGYVI